MTLRRPTPLVREALLAGFAAASLAALLLWAAPPGNDLAAHVYQRALFLKHGYVLWNNFWYAGRYSFVTYSLLYYPLSALLGLMVLALAASPLAFFFLVVVLVGVALAHRPTPQTLLVPAIVVLSGVALELALKRLFPGSGRFPFRVNQLVPGVLFCSLGALMTCAQRRARPLMGLFLAYLVACVVFFVVPLDLGSNVERLRYAAI